jgi:hypothetical protein
VSRLTCRHCQAKTEGVVLCKRCQTTAAVSLEAIPASHVALFSIGDIERPRTRQRSGPSDPTGSAVTRDRSVSKTETAAAETTAMLDTWVRRLLGDRPELVRPRDSVTGHAEFLKRNLRVIATLDWAGEFLGDLLGFERRLNRIVSRSQGYWYAGICGGITGEGPDDWCPQDLFVTPGDRFIRCRACRTFWSVDQRRDQVIAQARDALLPVAVIARAAVSLLEGEPSQQRLEARLRKWVERGDLDDYGVRVLEGRPRRVYRLGDVIDRLTREVSGIHA